jgi:hypothetical protein
MRILILSVAVFAFASAARAAAEPQMLRPAGDWRLSEVGGRVACTLTFTRQSSSAGYEVKAPLACRLAFPALKSVAGWALDDKGALVLSDAQAKPIIIFPAQLSAPFEARAPDGRTWRLEPLGEEAAPSAFAQPMAGSFRLTSAEGVTLCDLIFTSDSLGERGAISQGPCSPPWTDRGLAAWSIRGSRLTLRTRDGTAIVFFKSVSSGVYVIADPRAEPLSLRRR